MSEWEEGGDMEEFIRERKYRGVSCGEGELMQVFVHLLLALDAIHS